MILVFWHIHGNRKWEEAKRHNTGFRRTNNIFLLYRCYTLWMTRLFAKFLTGLIANLHAPMLENQHFLSSFCKARRVDLIHTRQFAATYASTTSISLSTPCKGCRNFASKSSKYSLLLISVNLHKQKTRNDKTYCLLKSLCIISQIWHYLLIVRSLANPSSLSTHKSGSSVFCDREDLGEIFRASATVTIFSNSSIGAASAVHNNLALFSYITWNVIISLVVRDEITSAILNRGSG